MNRLINQFGLFSLAQFFGMGILLAMEENVILPRTMGIIPAMAWVWSMMVLMFVDRVLSKRERP